MDTRIIYEQLMCDAFDCRRADYYFANADHFDGSNNHLEETFAILICALINIKKKRRNKEAIDSLIQKINQARTNQDYSFDFLSKVLEELNEKGILL